MDCNELKEKIKNTEFVFCYFGGEDEPFFKRVHSNDGYLEKDIAVVHNDDPECANEFGVKASTEIFFR